MLKKIKDIVIILFNVIILLFLIEVILDFYYSKKESNTQEKNTENFLNTNAHSEEEKKDIKEMLHDLYSQEANWAPYTHQKVKPYKSKHINIYPDGTRKTFNIPKIKSDSTIKVFCIGGSTTWGYGARDDNTIASYLSKMCSKDTSLMQIEIFNYGQWAYKRTQENILLSQILLKGNIPDIVIFYDGVNEGHGYLNNLDPILPLNSLKRENEFNIAINKKKLRKTLFEASNISKFIQSFSKRNSNSNKASDSTEKYCRKVFEIYNNNLKITQALASEYNFKVLNYWQPIIFSKSTLTTYEKHFANQIKVLEPLYKGTYSLVEENDSLLKEKYNYRNISNSFNREIDKTIFYDFFHTSEYGNKLIAEQIFKDLSPLLKKANK